MSTGLVIFSIDYRALLSLYSNPKNGFIIHKPFLKILLLWFDIRILLLLDGVTSSKGVRK